MRHGAESVTEELFPRQLRIGDHAFPLAYRFEPGHPMDGVTMNVPLALLNQVDEAAIDWLVPGMVRDKVAWTMKALPKRVRTLLVPVPEHVTKFLERAKPGERRIADEVLAYVSRLAGERLDADVWSKDELPAHLRDEPARRGRREARARHGPRPRGSCAGSWARRRASRSRSRSRAWSARASRAWDFGDLPAEVSFRRGNQSLTGYPALVDDGESVAIRLFDTRDKAAMPTAAA